MVKGNGKRAVTVPASTPRIPFRGWWVIYFKFVSIHLTKIGPNDPYMIHSESNRIASAKTIVLSHPSGKREYIGIVIEIHGLQGRGRPLSRVEVS